MAFKSYGGGSAAGRQRGQKTQAAADRVGALSQQNMEQNLSKARQSSDSQNQREIEKEAADKQRIIDAATARKKKREDLRQASLSEEEKRAEAEAGLKSMDDEDREAAATAERKQIESGIKPGAVGMVTEVRDPHLVTGFNRTKDYLSKNKEKLNEVRTKLRASKD